MTQLTRRGLLTGALGVGSFALLGSQWPRLTGADIPGRRDDSLSIAILGTNQDAAARQSLVDAFTARHPDISVRLQAIQGTDWADFFAKIHLNRWLYYWQVRSKKHMNFRPHFKLIIFV